MSDGVTDSVVRAWVRSHSAPRLRVDRLHRPAGVASSLRGQERLRRPGHRQPADGASFRQGPELRPHREHHLHQPADGASSQRDPEHRAPRLQRHWEGQSERLHQPAGGASFPRGPGSRFRPHVQHSERLPGHLHRQLADVASFPRGQAQRCLPHVHWPHWLPRGGPSWPLDWGPHLQELHRQPAVDASFQRGPEFHYSLHEQLRHLPASEPTSWHCAGPPDC